MRFPGAILALLGATSLANESEPEPLLPATIPGYELRVLDVAKPVVLFVAGTRLEASLPVFFYLPDSEQKRAIALVQQAYADLTELGRKEEWEADDLHRVLTQLDQALKIFQSTFGHPAALPSASPLQK
jgi:hypothetical protein